MTVNLKTKRHTCARTDFPATFYLMASIMIVISLAHFVMLIQYAKDLVVVFNKFRAAFEKVQEQEE